MVANIGRKVDGLDRYLKSSSSTRDENIIDTAVDLLVYSLRHQNYLADRHRAVAVKLFGSAVRAPYSDEVVAFEYLLDSAELSIFDEITAKSTIESVLAAAIARISELYERALIDKTGEPPLCSVRSTHNP
jgi:hypothetical protein